jgi:hypothetical protein
LALLVILKTVQALPVSQKPEEIEGIAIPVDEAKEFTYELNRDQDLKGSINGGQSGWALEQIAHGVKPDEVISGSRHSIYIRDSKILPSVFCFFVIHKLFGEHFLGTEFESWDGFGLVGSTEKNIRCKIFF